MKQPSWLKLAAVMTAPIVAASAFVLVAVAQDGANQPARAPFATPAASPPSAAPGQRACDHSAAPYEDPDGRFSLCVAGDWRALTAPAEQLGTVLSLQSPEAPATGLAAATLTVHWAPASAFDLGAVPEPCLPVAHWRDVEEVTVVLDGREVPACIGDATDYAHPNPGGPVLVRGTYAEVPIGPGRGYVILFVVEQEGLRGAGSAVLSTLQSLRIGPR